MIRTIEEAIIHAEEMASNYEEMVDDYALDSEKLVKCAKNQRQIAAWLRELQERRKAPEIITCGECEHFRQEPDGEMWCGVSKGHGIDKDFFCGDAERRTE